MTLVFLETSTFQGIVSGAYHYWARLVCSSPYKEVKLQYKIDELEAEILNRDCDWGPYKAGESIDKFFSEQAALEEARKSWRKHFPMGAILLKGNLDHLDPESILDYIPSYKTLASHLSEINTEFEKNNRWEGDEKKAKKICAKWDLALRQANLK